MRVLDGLGFRTRLFLVSVGLLVAFGLISGLWLERGLGPVIDAQVEGELEQQAHLAAELVERSAQPMVPAVADELADTAGRGANVRISIITADGTVVGDSMVDASDLPALDNHGTRPEVAEAFAGRIGVSRRFSRTTEMGRLYVAVPYRRPEGDGCVRVSVSLSEATRTLRSLRTLLFVGELVGLVASAFLSFLASRWITGGLRRLVDHARQLAGGEPAEPIRLEGSSEVRGIAGSINALSADLDRAVRALAAERNRLDALVSGLVDGLVALDSAGLVTLVNPAARELLELRAPIVGRPLVEGVRSPQLVDLAGRALAGAASAADVELRSGRDVRQLSVTAMPQTGGGCVVVLHDVTEVRRLERMRRDFVANVSHELRTPIGILRASADALADGALEDPKYGPEFVDAIVRNSERLGALLNDLLTLSRLDAGKAELRLADVDVAPLVDRVARELGSRAEARGQRFRVTVTEGCRVRADAGGLEQVLVNLLDNAVKYSVEGGEITIAAVRRDGRVILEVRDTGPGIPAHHHGRLFERFYRADKGRSRDVGGTGLGLSIVKNLVESMGGRVGVRDNRPRGTVFFVDLAEVETTAVPAPPAAAG